VLYVQELLLNPVCWAALLGCLAATIGLLRFARTGRRDFQEQECEKSGNRKKSKPFLMGLAIGLPFLAAVLACAFGIPGIPRGAGGQSHGFLLVLLGGFIILALGAADEVRNLSAGLKLAAEFLAGLLVALSGIVISAVNLPLVGLLPIGDPAGFGTVLTVLWVVGIVNAVSVLDDMDGQAPGVGAIAAIALTLLAGMNGATLAVLLGLGLTGSLLAILQNNRTVVRISLGNAGSLTLGYALAVVSLAGSCSTSGSVLGFSTVAALGVPLFESFAAILRSHLGGYPLFCINLNPSSRMPMKGFTPRQTAWLMYAGSLMCMAAALLSAIIPTGSVHALVPIAVIALTLGGLVVMAGHTKSILSRYGSRRDTMRCMALSRYAAMRLRSKASAENMQRVLDMLVHELELLNLEIRYNAGRANHRSSRSSWDPQPVSWPGDEERLHLKAADASPIELVFQCADKVCPARRDMVATCLATVFDGLSTSTRCQTASQVVKKSVPSSGAASGASEPMLVKQAVGR